MGDSIAGEGFVVSAEVTCNATGPAETSGGAFVTKTTPGVELVEHFYGSVRPAVASGTLLGAGTTFWPLTGNQIPLPSISGTIQDLKNGTVTIRH